MDWWLIAVVVILAIFVIRHDLRQRRRIKTLNAILDGLERRMDERDWSGE